MRKHVLPRLLLAAVVSFGLASCAGHKDAPLLETAATESAPPTDGPAATTTDAVATVAMPTGTTAITTPTTPMPIAAADPAPPPPEPAVAQAFDATTKSGADSGRATVASGLAGEGDMTTSRGHNNAGPAVSLHSTDSRKYEAQQQLEAAKLGAKNQALEVSRGKAVDKPMPMRPPTEMPANEAREKSPLVRDGLARDEKMQQQQRRLRADDGDDAGGDDMDGRFAVTNINPLVDPRVDRLSTFAIDVDTGSFSLSRRFLEQGAMPVARGVRVEEWVNAFHYSYAGPDVTGSKHPFAIDMEGAPLAKQSTVLRIGIQGKRIAKQHRDPVHLTFLVDVSGSMRPSDRLPLAKQSLDLLVDELNDKDSVSLVTYAGGTQVVLPATDVTQANRSKIKAAIESLQNGGGTNMGSGMELAYREANKALGAKGISRVIVLSDGDANIGKVSHGEILQAIKGYVSEGVTMSTIGFGTGNYRDDTMEGLADAGNGNYSYVGSLKDAKKIFVDDLSGTLQVIAKDTKIQVEMNPDVVKSYRLIGYENRDIADADFRNDKVDAGEIGAGHTVTALYEVTFRDDDPTGNIATVRVRYKQPKGDEATEVASVFPASALKQNVSDMSVDGRFAVGLGLAAEVFRHSPHMDRLGIDLADAERIMAGAASGPFASERKDFVRLIGPLANGANVARR